MSEARYTPHDAAAVAYQSLPAMMRTGLTEDDVLQILYYEFEYYDTAARKNPTLAAAPPAPTPLDLELLVASISGAAAKVGRSYTAEQIAHVLKAEDQYLRQLGLIE